VDQTNKVGEARKEEEKQVGRRLVEAGKEERVTLWKLPSNLDENRGKQGMTNSQTGKSDRSQLKTDK